MTNQTNKPTEPGIWTREGKFYRVWQPKESRLGRHLVSEEITDDGRRGEWCDCDSLPPGNWHKLTAPATNAEALEKFRGWLKGHCNQSSDEQIADKAAEIFAGVEPEQIDWTRIREWAADPRKKPPQLAFTAGPEREIADLICMVVMSSESDQIATLKATVTKLEEQVAAEHAKYVNSERAATVALQAQTIIKQAEEIAELKRDKRTLEFQLHEAQQERNAEQSSANRWRETTGKAVTIKGCYLKTLQRLASVLDVEMPIEPRDTELVEFIQKADAEVRRLKVSQWSSDVVRFAKNHGWDDGQKISKWLIDKIANLPKVVVELPQGFATQFAKVWWTERRGDELHVCVSVESPQPTVIEGKGQAVTGVYVASRASLPERPAMWRKLRGEGWPINSTWIDEAGEGETKSMQELWARIAREIAAASAVVLYAEEGDLPLKGALIEVGMAIGMGKPVFACLPGVALDARSFRPVGSWLAHPLVTRLNSTELIANRLGIPPRPAFVAPPKPEQHLIRYDGGMTCWAIRDGDWYRRIGITGGMSSGLCELLDEKTGEPIKEQA
jgi:hypothetical protein